MRKDNSPLVSVLMTAYNREKYIDQAIESVLASTYTNIELIIVGDCSNDNTKIIAKKYELSDNRVKLYVNERNLGDYPNRNKAASFAKGMYIKYIDADDYIYPWGLELLIEMMEEFPAAGWGLCSLEQYVKKPFAFELNPREAYEYHYFGPGLFHKAPLSSIIKREIFAQSGGFCSLRMVGDFEMWHRLAQTYSVVLMPQGIVWYREHDEQEIREYDEFIHDYQQIKIKYLKSEKCPLDYVDVSKIITNEKKQLLKQLVKSVAMFDLKMIKCNKASLKLCNE